MQDELDQLWKGDMFRNKTKDTEVDQEVQMSKMAIFDRKQLIFVGIHPAFQQQ